MPSAWRIGCEVAAKRGALYWKRLPRDLWISWPSPGMPRSHWNRFGGSFQQPSKRSPLTQKLNLGRAFVQEAAARYEWWDFFHRLTTELEVPYLHELHHFARRLKLVRRKGRKLLLAPAGKRGLKDIETLWRTVAHGLFVGEDFEQAVAEVLFPLLIAEGEIQTDEIEARIAPILAEQGWSTRDEWGGSVPINERGAARGMWDITRIAVPFGMMAKGGDWRDRSLALTAFGVATGLEGLRARSIAPRRNVFA
ncbi:MAG: hypothetical protein M3454_05860 [Actinomycetota bacterium]|nr:hypothetical protein [Actinomycetota bacterium]